MESQTKIMYESIVIMSIACENFWDLLTGSSYVVGKNSKLNWTKIK